MGLFYILFWKDVALSAVCTAICTLSAMFLRDSRPRINSAVLGLFAGYFTAMSVAWLIPQSIQKSGVALSLASVVSGVLVTLAMAKQTYGEGRGAQYGSLVTLAFSSCICGLVYGIGIAGGYKSNTDVFGFSSACIFKMLRLSAISVTLLSVNWKPISAFFILTLMCVPDALGIFIGAWNGHIPGEIFGVLQGFCTGAVLYSTLGYCLADAVRLYYGNITVISIIVGVLTAWAAIF